MGLPTWVDLSIYLFTVRKLDKSCESMYRSRYNIVFDYFVDRNYDKPSIYSFFDYLQTTRKLSNETLNGYLKLLKHVERMLDLHNLDDFSYFVKKETHIDELTHEEMTALTDAGYKHDFRRGLIIEILCKTAIRRGELFNLEWKDVYRDHLLLRDTKSGKDQEVYLIDELYQKIQKLHHFPHGYVFGSEYGKLSDKTLANYLVATAKEAGIKRHVYPHLLRHSAATYAAKVQSNPFKVQKFLRHADISTTMRYVHLDREDLRVVAEAMSPESMSFEAVRSRVEEFVTSLRIYPYTITFSSTTASITLLISTKDIVI